LKTGRLLKWCSLAGRLFQSFSNLHTSTRPWLGGVCMHDLLYCGFYQQMWKSHFDGGWIFTL